MSLKTLQYALWALVAIVGGGLGGYFYVNGLPGSQGLSLQSASTGAPTIGGPFELVDHNGATMTEAALAGSPSILFFGFTHCPEICPTTLSDISGWLEAVGDEGKDIKSYFVTVDPERDSPEIMKDYVTAFSDRITGLTGSPEKVQQILQNYRVYSNKVRLGDGDYTMDHTASVILLDSKGEFVSTISYGEQPKTAVDKLKLLVKRG
ncbi:MAG: SCO family protein [Pseudomonadota bacterium]